jgi:predicted MPP superfamily phosphohydrolase
MNFERRDLLKLGFGAALMQAAAPFSAVAETLKSGNPYTGKLIDKYLKVSKLTLKVGASKPFTAVHFTDTHVSMSDAKDILGGNERSLRLYEARRPRFPVSLQTLAATIAYAEKRGAMLLNTGDLFDYQSDANISCVANSFAGRNVFSSLGNHESYGHHTKDMNPANPAEAKALREKFEKAYAQDVIVASKVVNGVNFVAFDNGGLQRWYRKEQLESIKAELKKNLPTVLMCHIPFDTPEMRAFVELKQSEKLKKPWKFKGGVGGYLQTEGDGKLFNEFRAHKDQIKAIICGHLHRQHESEWNGIPMIIGGGNFEGVAREIEFV